MLVNLNTKSKCILWGMFKKLLPFFSEKSILHYQVCVYLHWLEQRGLNSMYDNEWLSLFATTSSVSDVYSITDSDIDRFLESIRTRNSTFVYDEAQKTILKLIRFYKARTKKVCYNIDMKTTMGRTPEIERIKEVKLLRDKAGLSFREIAKKLGVNDLKTVYRWYMYPEKRLNLYVKRRQNALSTGKFAG